MLRRNGKEMLFVANIYLAIVQIASYLRTCERVSASRMLPMVMLI